MAATSSTMLELGTQAPSFTLPRFDAEAQGESFNSSSLPSGPLLVMFLCNHCPFVKHIREHIADLASEFQGKGVSIVGISSNDVEHYPADAPEAMVREAQEASYTFPYLYDESQEVAKAFQAACTPEFYLFDKEHLLVYRGQLDRSRPSNGIPVSGEDLRDALNRVVADEEPRASQQPSVGCNIKWKPGNAPSYYQR